MTAFVRPLSAWLFAAALLATSFALRWPGLERKVWNLDEGSTLTMAEIVRHGGVLYRDAADNRTPLVPYLKAGVLAVAGDWNMRAVHLVLAALVGLTAIGIWRSLSAAGDAKTGAWGAVYFLLLGFVMPGPVDVMAAHTGWFLVFFSAWGMWAFIRALRGGATAWALAAGLLFGLSTLAKQPGLLDWGACLVLCALVALNSPMRKQPILIVAGGLLAGWVLILTATWAYFSANDAWDDFLRYAWDYNTKLYVPEVPLAQRLWAIRVPFVQLWESAPLALLLGGAAAIWLLVRAVPPLFRRDANFALPEWLVLGWAASGLASTMLSGRDFGHYTIQTMPGLALGCGWITTRLLDRAAPWTAGRRRMLSAALAAVPLSIALVAIPRSFRLEADDPAAEKIGALIREVTRPEDRMFIWGYVPELHVFAERLPNTRFVYAVYLTGMIPWTNLDPLKNTDYAIVPGAWDAFWSDFEARRPEIIVDTRLVRGFMKYPLRKQERLWSIVESDYAELDSETFKAIGYSLFKRLASPREVTTNLRQDGGLNLQTLPVEPGAARRVEVRFPAGALAIDLLLDGRPYRRLESPGQTTTSVIFALPAADLPPGRHAMRAIVTTSNAALAVDATLELGDTAPALRGPLGPPIEFDDGTRLEPAEAGTIDSDHVGFREDDGYWLAHAPSKLVYERPPEMSEFEFSYGIASEAYQRTTGQRTDGVDVLILFEDQEGRQTQLFRRELRPVTEGVDQGVQTNRLTLPPFQRGRLLLVMTAGPLSNPAFDWSYWKNLKAQRNGLAVRTATGWLSALRLEAPFGITRVGQGQHQVTLAHAPTEITYAVPASGGRLQGEFGLLETSWTGSGKSEGAVFEVRFKPAGGEFRSLWQQTLRPADNLADRQKRHFTVDLPAMDGPGELQLVTRPANPRNNAFNHTFWNDLRLDPPPRSD